MPSFQLYWWSQGCGAVAAVVAGLGAGQLPAPLSSALRFCRAAWAEGCGTGCRAAVARDSPEQLGTPLQSPLESHPSPEHSDRATLARGPLAQPWNPSPGLCTQALGPLPSHCQWMWHCRAVWAQALRPAQRLPKRLPWLPAPTSAAARGPHGPHAGAVSQAGSSTSTRCRAPASLGTGTQCGHKGSAIAPQGEPPILGHPDTGGPGGLSTLL